MAVTSASMLVGRKQMNKDYDRGDQGRQNIVIRSPNWIAAAMDGAKFDWQPTQVCAELAGCSVWLTCTQVGKVVPTISCSLLHGTQAVRGCVTSRCL
jgi:hypothetical protein